MAKPRPQLVSKVEARNLRHTKSYQQAVSKQKEISKKVSDASQKLQKLNLNEYQNEYSQLSPEIKEHFYSPDKLKQEISKESLSQLNSKKTQIEQAMIDNKAYFDKKIPTVSKNAVGDYVKKQVQVHNALNAQLSAVNNLINRTKKGDVIKESAIDGYLKDVYSGKTTVMKRRHKREELQNKIKELSVKENLTVKEFIRKYSPPEIKMSHVPVTKDINMTGTSILHDNRTNRNLNRMVSPISGNISPISMDKKKSKVMRFFEGGLINPAKSLGKGIYKSKYEVPWTEYVIKSPQGRIKDYQASRLGIKRKELIKDKDYQAALVGVGLGGATVIAPTAGTIALGGLSAKQYYETTKNPTPENLGLSTFMSIPLVGPVYKTAKGGFIRIGSQKVPVSQVLDEQVLSGKTRFPTTKGKSIPSQVKEFERGGYLQTSTTFKPKRNDVAKTGFKGKKNLEDAGLWGTPKGRGSPHFLGIKPKEGIGFTLNPFQKQPNPNIVLIKVKDFKRLPENIRNTKNFRKVNQFLKSRNLKEEAYIPLRSELKQTPEIQAILPEGTPLKHFPTSKISKIKGFDQHVIYNKQAVPIRVYRTTNKPNTATSKSISKKIKKYQKYNQKYSDNYASYKRVLKPQELVYPYYNKNSSLYYNPYFPTRKGGTYGISNYDSFSRYVPYTGNNYNPSQGKVYEPGTRTTQSYTYGSTNYPQGYVDLVNPYKPYGVPLRYTPKPKKPSKRFIRDSKKVQTAYRPVMQDSSGNIMVGDPFKTYKGAVSEGMIATDESPAVSFKVKKDSAPKGIVKTGRNIYNSNKFTKSNNIYVEKNRYRSDRPREKGNIMNFLGVYK